MKLFSGAVLFFVLVGSNLPAFDHAGKNKEQLGSWAISGFRDAAGEQEVEKKFMAVPDPKLAEEHLRILTQAPHIAGSPEDKATAEYVAKKFREAGLDTEIVEYKVWLNYPAEIRVDMTAPRRSGDAWAAARACRRRSISGRSARRDALQRHVALGRRRGGSCLCELRLAR